MVLGLVAATLAPAEPLAPFPLARIVRLLAFIGFTSQFLLLVRSWTDLRARAMLGRAALFMVLGISLNLILTTAAHASPLKYDRYLYGLDLVLGSPAFRLGRVFAAMPTFASLEAFIYYSLPLALTGWYAAHIAWSDRHPSILRMMYVNALLGFSLYFVVPAAGPSYTFPTFPYAPLHIALALIPVAAAPNCVPSLHVAGALLIAWSSGRAKIPAAVYLLLTVLATLGFGEHYVIDLVIAVPYALLIQGVGEKRWDAVGSGALLTGLWMVTLRYGILGLHPLLLWPMIGVTIAAVIRNRSNATNRLERHPASAKPSFEFCSSAPLLGDVRGPLADVGQLNSGL